MHLICEIKVFCLPLHRDFECAIYKTNAPFTASPGFRQGARQPKIGKGLRHDLC